MWLCGSGYSNVVQVCGVPAFLSQYYCHILYKGEGYDLGVVKYFKTTSLDKQ